MSAETRGPAATTKICRQPLCAVCRQIDVDKILNPWDALLAGEVSEELAVIDLEPSDAESRNCPFCTAFRLTYKDFGGHEIDKLCIRLFSGKNNRYHRWITVDKFPIEPRQRRGVLFCCDDRNPDGLIVEVTPFISSYASLKKWVDRCHTTHPVCRDEFSQSSQQLTYKMRLIDCIERKVIDAPSRAEYFTLSYVWGPPAPSPVERGRQSDASIEDAPLTIRDAVDVTLKLGLRYLWVDRYCVKAGEEAVIHRMNEIYRGARATLVAAYGENDNAGLPGVSVVPRVNLPKIKLPGCSLIPKTPPLEDILASSRWNTRGWTYQEALLSRCCLFFTQRGVHFACHYDGRCEHGPHLLRSRLKVPQRMEMLVRTRRLKPEIFSATYVSDQLNSSLSQTIYGHVLSYTNRDLTYDKDGLNAFHGILQATGVPSLWGVPMICESGLVPSLCKEPATLLLSWFVLRFPRLWGNTTVQPRTESRRRPNFPTWSWPSVTGRISLADGNFYDDVHSLLSGSSDFSLHCRQDDTTTALEDLVAIHSSPIIDSGRYRELFLEGTLIEMEFHQQGSDESLTSSLKNGDRLEWTYYPDIYSADTEASDDFETVYGFVLHRGTVYSNSVVMVVKWVDSKRAERLGIAASPSTLGSSWRLASRATDMEPRMWSEVDGKYQFILQ